jgi:TetR/AcrR family transcriptional regulator, regulator of mycofactocin system
MTTLTAGSEQTRGMNAQTSASDNVVGPWDRRRIRASLELEYAALSLMANHGIDSVTVDQVATAAGISKRSFFRYFRNVPDVLTALPRRQTERLCQRVLSRPREEDLLGAIRAVYREDEATRSASELDHNDELRRKNFALWSGVVRSNPEAASTSSHATAILARGLEKVVCERLGIADDDLITAGVLAAAVAGAMWFAYVRWLELGANSPLTSQLDAALDRLALLHRQSEPSVEMATRRRISRADRA